jgi:PLAT/LH2 domain
MLYVALLNHKSFNSSDCINVTLSFNALSCANWSGIGCKIGRIYSIVQFECKCKGPGTFSATLQVPKAWLDVPRNVSAKFEKNFIGIVLCATAIVSLFVISILNKQQCNSLTSVINLEQNHPEHKFHYVLAVSSGKCTATFKVCIQLFGLRNTSEVHLICDENFNFLCENSTQNFLVTSGVRLGSLAKLVVWIMPTRYDSLWHCNKILIYDLNQRQVWTFHIEKSFSLADDRLVAMPATAINSGALTCYNFICEYTECLLSFRVNNIMMICVILFILVINSILFGATTLMTVEWEMVELKDFDIKLETVILSIKSFAIILFVIVLAILMKCLCKDVETKRKGSFESEFLLKFGEE